MSTSTPGAAPAGTLPKIENLNIAIVRAQWNGHITSALADGAVEILRKEGYDIDSQVHIFEVPGAVELTFAASALIEASMFDAIIVLGCVVRG
ncbi:MAG: 6,7-dimethyl-8-ribityllumazine synthase, partial [Muribaculaceae bacterium]|nr:6,7-dimethyl-8-ribityllumazine synthase [Muribaculaceae bacterium]